MTDFIRSYGSGFIFTTSMPPTVLASALAAIEVRKFDIAGGQRKQEEIRKIYFRFQKVMKVVRYVVNNRKMFENYDRN